ELINYRWARPEVYNLDRVSQPVATPDGGTDFIGRFGLLVSLAPRIVSQPHDASVFAEDSVSFEVAATGTGPLSYQWLFNGTEIPGATEPALTLSNVTPEQAGGYSVRVSNS